MRGLAHPESDQIFAIERVRLWQRTQKSKQVAIFQSLLWYGSIHSSNRLVVTAGGASLRAFCTLKRMLVPGGRAGFKPRHEERRAQRLPLRSLSRGM